MPPASQLPPPSPGFGPLRLPEPCRAPGQPSMIDVPFESRAQVRVGLIGAGRRGRSLMQAFLEVPGVVLRAVADLLEEPAELAAAVAGTMGHPTPEVIWGEEADLRLCARGDLDLVVLATPWSLHASQAVWAMSHGAHVAVDVPVATTLEDLWRLVDVSERTRRHVVLLENVAYMPTELLVLRLAREGFFGELVHGEAAYCHDLRRILFERGEGLWWRPEHGARNGNLYPTHGLAPIALAMDWLRGDRPEVLVSLSSFQHGLGAWRDGLPTDDPRRGETYVCGDLNSSLLRTAKGRTLSLQYDVVSPRPYDRGLGLFGTRACFRDYPPRFYVEGQKSGQWRARPDLLKRAAHPWWSGVPFWRSADATPEQKHAVNVLMARRLVEALRLGRVPDLDVYDAATWTAPAPLSEASVAGGGLPVAFPDFTRGAWDRPREARPFGA